MRALTLWRPWPYAIFHGGQRRKLIENRDWEPPRAMMHQIFALHAGKTFDRDGAQFIQKQLGLTGLPPAAWLEGVIGITKIIGLAHRREEVIPEQQDWFFGDVGFVLDPRCTIALPRPIECKGAQGFWTLPPDMAAELAALEPPIERVSPFHPGPLEGDGGPFSG